MNSKEKKKLDAVTDVVINYLHKNYISLQDNDMKEYVNHFRKVLNQIITLMKEVDALFNVSYREICGAGSYYDQLKVGKPEEFDMDVIIKLPVNTNKITIVNEDVVPAFTKVEMKSELQLLRKHPKWTEVYRHIESWVDEDGFLLQTGFKQWFESVVVKALNTMPQIKPNVYELTVVDPVGNTDTKYKVSLRKSGPAMTFFITIPPDGVQVDVDFVPVIEFSHPQWPPHHVRPLPDSLIKAKKIKWFIVPKPKKVNTDGTIWRLAFHDQEREMISDKGVLKPVCRMLKKFRDENNVNIASYYLKTLFLWEIEEHSEIEYWRKRHGDMFLYMLEKLSSKLKEGSIPYFWDRRYNLLEGLEKANKDNIMFRLNKVIADIRRKTPNEPQIIAKYLLPKEEYEKVKLQFLVPVELTPAQLVSSPPAMTKKESKVSLSKQKLAANEQVKANSPASDELADAVDSVSQDNTNCTNCTVKMEIMMDVLNQLLKKVNGLEKMMEVLQSQNKTLKDQLFIKVNSLETMMDAIQNENENLKDRLSLIQNAQNVNAIDL